MFCKQKCLKETSNEIIPLINLEKNKKKLKKTSEERVEESLKKRNNYFSKNQKGSLM
jgi:hypothetical protein